MEVLRGCLSGCFLLQDLPQLLERRIRATSTATGASIYSQVKIAWIPHVHSLHLFSPIFHFSCFLWTTILYPVSHQWSLGFALRNTGFSYCSVPFLGHIDVILLPCGEKAEDNPLWSLKRYLEVLGPISYARAIIRWPAGNWQCRFAWVWDTVFSTSVILAHFMILIH